LPRAANILREREQHIEKLDHEISLKDREVAQLGEERSRLTEMFRTLKLELEERNRWAEQLNERLAEAAASVHALQGELEDQSRGYEAKIAELEQDNRARAEWAIETESRLTRELAAKCQELAECVEALHKVEHTLEERTEWARGLDRRVQDLDARLGLAMASRWVKLGNAIGVGPRLRKG
jgi:chromosome segregation ATPase